MKRVVHPRFLRFVWIPALLLVWIICVYAGMQRMFAFEFTPGPSAHTPELWPGGTTIQLAGTSPTLILGLHPRCSCSFASLDELAFVLARCPRVSARLLFYRPAANDSAEWKTDLRRRAEKLPRVTVIDDPGGLQASRLGLATSGETLLYTPAGKLIFKGGITGSRGHAGENISLAALIRRIQGDTGGLERTPAFGCSLLAGSSR